MTYAGESRSTTASALAVSPVPVASAAEVSAAVLLALAWWDGRLARWQFWRLARHGRQGQRAISKASLNSPARTASKRSG